MKIERWKHIKGWEGKYMISSSGRIYSFHSERILKTDKRINNSGYESISLGSNFVYMVHRLVAEAFLGEIHKGQQVNHKNCNKRDNHLENLEIVSAKENMEHAKKSGRTFRKVSDKIRDEIIRFYSDGLTQTKIAEIFKLSNQHVSRIIRRLS